MTVIDTITADQIEPGDLIDRAWPTDDDGPIEVETFFDGGDVIVVKGYSHSTGESGPFFFKPTDTVNILGA